MVLCKLASKTFGVELLLVSYVITTILSVLVSYVLAVHYGHVIPYFPFISQTAEHAPESCIFTFGMNVAAILAFAIVFVRYKHVVYLYANTTDNGACLNVSSALAGYFSALGGMLIANFQNRAVHLVHISGALLVFFFGLVYQWLQTILSFRIYKAKLTQHCGVCVLSLRVLMTVMSTAIIIIALLLGCLELKKPESIREIGPLIYSLCEWALVLSILLYNLTFHPEFAAVSTSFTVKKNDATLPLPLASI